MSNGLLRKQAMSIEIIGTGSRTKTRNLRDHVGQCDEDPDIDDDRQPTDNQIQQKLNGSAVPDLELGVAVGMLVAIVATRQGPLKPAVKNDEQIARSHLLEPELGSAVPAVFPRVRQHRVTIATDDAFQRQFNR